MPPSPLFLQPLRQIGPTQRRHPAPLDRSPASPDLAKRRPAHNSAMFQNLGAGSIWSQGVSLFNAARCAGGPVLAGRS